jgi:hypothetical protein
VGVNTWMLVAAERNAREALASRPLLDREATTQLARSLFPDEKLECVADVDLCHTSPSKRQLHIGSFAGVSIVAAKEFGIDHPSKLPNRFITALPGRELYLHAMHSTVDCFAFGRWIDGTLVRALSVSPDTGVVEDIGHRSPFEEPFWLGEHPAAAVPST